MQDMIFYLFLDVLEVYAIVAVGCAPIWAYRFFVRKPSMNDAARSTGAHEFQPDPIKGS